MKRKTFARLSALVFAFLMAAVFSVGAFALDDQQLAALESITRLGLYKQYAGQYGYGAQKIYDPVAYLEDRYQGKAVLQTSKILPTANFLMRDVHPEYYEEGAKYEWGDCQNVAITRTLQYLAQNGYDKIPADYKEVYEYVDQAVAQVNKRSGYSALFLDKLLKIPTLAPLHGAVVRQVLTNLGYPRAASYNAYYAPFSLLQSEIDANRPPVINYLSVLGFYQFHVVTANGYQVYKVTDAKGSERTVNLALTYDGHTKEQMYVDYSVLHRYLQGFLIIINPEQAA